MPEIRLQDYVAEIKELIRSIRLDEAIAHSQHILRHYPKHIESYCLLGEACLEKEMYREAIEFFQRTLGADPENLIARVGLGVIYDEQGAFPEAIWQLERAFELVPGNAEVRRELLRLYSQYDKIDKTRLRLTRGALGRLYSRNGLYERAISEFRAVLSQDPELPDVRVALIEALWREGRQVDVVELCLDLLDDLPNCLKANLILGDTWLRGGDEESAHHRLSVARELDPENNVARELMGEDSPLPPEEVLIPKLDLMPGELGAPLAAAAVAGVVLAAEEEAEAPWDTDEELPEWLRDVGVTAEEPAEELAVEEVLEPPPDEALPTEEMPEWLQEVMGEEGPPPAGEPLAAEGELQEEDLAVVESEPEPMPELESLWELEEEPEPAVVGVPEEEMPEWLQELVGEAESVSGEEPVVEVQEPPAAVPTEAEKEELEIEGVEELGFVAPLVAKVMEGTPVLEEEAPPEDETPDWLRDLDSVTAEEVAAPPTIEPGEEPLVLEEEAPSDDEMPDWLRDLGVAEVEEGALEAPIAEAETLEMPAPLDAEEGDLLLADEEIPLTEETPAWLREMDRVEVEEVALPPVVDLEEKETLVVEEEALSDDELPDWLRDLGVTEVEEEVAEPPPAEAETVAISAPPIEKEELAAAEEEIPVIDQIPDWLRELEEAKEEEEPEVPESLRALVEAGLLDEADIESAMAEMSAEDLAAQRAEEVPSWLSELMEEEETVAEVVEPEPEPVIEEVAAEAWPEPEPVIEEAAVEVEREPEPVVEEAAVEVEPEPVIEEVAAEVVEPELEPVIEEVAAEAWPEPEPVIQEAVAEAEPEPEPEPVIEEAVLEPEEEIEAPSRLDDLLNQLKTRPRDYNARLELARLHYGEQDWDRALASYEKLISARRFLPDVVDDLQSLVGQDVDQSRIYHMLGDAYMQQDQLDEALEMYRLARQKLTRR